jgi:choline dehydrogenase-like flavoprotein
MCCSAPGRSPSSLFETGGFWYADPDARSPDIQFHLGLGSGIEAGVARLKNAGVTLNSAYLHPRSQAARCGLRVQPTRRRLR